MNEEEILAFVRATITSVWALEVLFLLRGSGQARTSAEIERELRGSRVAVTEALQALQRAGLVAEKEAGKFGYQPAASALDEMVAAAAALYMMKPVAVVRAIAARPSDKLQSFSDAFRFRE